METNPTPQRTRASGMALVLTVFTLGMLTILVVGFLTSMMTEEKAASAYQQSQRTKLIAEGAVNHAIDLLRTNIPEPARLAEGPLQAPGENWITNPGRLTIIKSGQPPSHIPLHTGEVTSEPDSGPLRDAESVDLNKPLPGQSTPAITQAENPSAERPIMRVKWVNLFEKPAEPPSAENRLTARYAFWLDDESTKLNFNTALGKPATGDARFKNQLTAGFMPPIFKRGGNDTTSGDGDRSYALGKPESVNLDILFDQPQQLLHDKRLAHTFLNGYYRYPEAIMDFINVPNPKAWFDQHKFNLTFYNRSPEFNAFGRSRLFTSYIPLSLEAGPSYQQPFIYDPQANNGEIHPKGIEGDLLDGTLQSGRLKDTQILSLNSLLGFFGASKKLTDPSSGYQADQANMINRNQIQMFMDYFSRTWPGYNHSFIEKYGYLESYQIALNILQFARIATTQVGNNLNNFSNAWGMRSTSVNFFPSAEELNGHAPERFYWRVKDPQSGNVKLMLPQMPGPHITEVRLFVRPITPDPSTQAPKSGTLNAYSRYIEYWYEIEYYMHPFGPVVDLKYFPTRVDYLELNATAAGKNISQQFGPTDGDDPRADKGWQNNFMDLLATYPKASTIIGPENSKWQGNPIPNRITVTSPKLVVGQFKRNDANAPGGKSDAPARKIEADETTNLSAQQIKNIWDPVIFDKSKPAGANQGKATVSFRFRPGQGILEASNRPRQMIPIGLTPNDTLQATFEFQLDNPQTQVVSWQIEDPRLSHDLSQWIKSGPGPENSTGTPNTPNLLASAGLNEPSETSSQKSKFRYTQRAPNGATISNYAYDRPDEYNTNSRVASIGYWSLLHTGMQSSIPWRTLNLTSTANDSDPPDWLLLDLFGATYPMAHDQWKIDQKLPDSFSTASYMGSTAGQVNLNSRIYPQNQWFNPPKRTLPLKGVFKELRDNTQIDSLIQQIDQYQTNSQFFDYIGELTNVPDHDGSASTQWLKETPLRNMAGVLTTRTNTFGMWGVAQTIKKSTRNPTHDAFEIGDRITGEKRFFALIERYLWTGRDGVPGNGHLSNGGTWDRRAQQAETISTTDGITDTLFQLPGSPPLKRPSEGAARLDLDTTGTYAKYDGPEPVGMDVFTAGALGSVSYSPSSLEEAYNPPQALIKFRVIYFKYLDQ